MIQSFLENFIKANGKEAFIKRLRMVLDFVIDLKKSVLISLFIAILLFIGTLVFILYNYVDIKLQQNNANFFDITTILAVMLAIFSFISILTSIKKLIRINITTSLIEDLMQDLAGIDDLDQISLQASKWVRKLSKELSISRATFSRILVKANYNNFKTLKQFVL